LERDLSVAEVAAEIGAGAGEVKGLFTTRYGPTINFAMKLARWLDRSAASFMWEHDGRGLPWSGRRV
jgi:plasmid maintenance system antidote protein VapI